MTKPEGKPHLAGEAGQSLAEYSLVIALVALLVTGGFVLLGDRLPDLLASIRF